MEGSIDIAQLRANGRLPEFCLSVTPQFLATVTDLLLKGHGDLSPEDQDNLMATIGNILLLNRSLDSGGIKNDLLAFLNSFTRHDFFCRKEPQYTRQVLVYRLYFLLGIGDHSMVEPSVWTETLEVLHQSFDFIKQSCTANLTQPGFRELTTELLKALVNIYAANPQTIGAGFRLKAIAAFIQSIREDLLATDSIMHNLLTLLMLSFSDFSLLESEIVDNFVDYSEFVQALVGLLRKTDLGDQPGTITDVISMYAFLIEILQVLKRSTDADKPRLSLYNLLRRELLPYTDRDIFQRNVEFLAQDKCGDPRRICLSGLILKFYYLICCDWSDTSGDAQVREFVGLFGYILAKRVLDDEGKAVPADINIANTLQPNPTYLLVSVAPPEPALADVFQKAIASRLQNTSVEMSPEEKEHEAEKLFVIFDRMERSGAFQDFKNPCRQWQELT